jgi:hypothetical protein
VSFFVDIADCHLEYLRDRAGLTPEGFGRLRDRLAALLEDCTATFRDERRTDPPPGGNQPSTYFEVTHVFPDAERIYLVRLIVNDSAAAYGVLRVVFVDCTSSP